METIIEILIDASGSMGYMKGVKEFENKCLIDGQTRMTFIKKVIIDELMPIIKYADKIIIRTFRLNIIESEKKYNLSIPIIYEDRFDSENIKTIISKIEDPLPGGTPIAEAILAAQSNLQLFPNSDRKIIIFTDGEESSGGGYNGNYVQSAKNIESLEGIPCKIYVIGLSQNKVEEAKSRAIAKSGGYFNITSEKYSSIELQKILSPFKIDILQRTIENFQTTRNLLPDSLRVQALLDSGIDAPTLTIDENYSEEIRLKSEDYLYKKLCEKYGNKNVRWLNQSGESFAHHDFELLNEQGEIVSLIECKGTPLLKPTFYLTKQEWHHFLKNKKNYQLYRVYNLNNIANHIHFESLFDALIDEKVVPYLLKPEILKDGRVFLTIIE